MITAIMAAGEMHVVYVIQREGLTKIRAKSLCSVEEDAGPGVYQVPDWAFDGRLKYGETPVCAKCARTTTMLKDPPPK